MRAEVSSEAAVLGDWRIRVHVLQHVVRRRRGLPLPAAHHHLGTSPVHRRKAGAVDDSRPGWYARCFNEQDEARDPIARSRELARILRKREIPMGEIIDKTKGKIKQVAGTLTGKDKLKADGEVDELKGRAKGAVEDIKHAAKDAAK
jgi:uncharacterized protein YjbJ (UPF0337 family)